MIDDDIIVILISFPSSPLPFACSNKHKNIYFLVWPQAMKQLVVDQPYSHLIENGKLTHTSNYYPRTGTWKQK